MVCNIINNRIMKIFNLKFCYQRMQLSSQTFTKARVSTQVTAAEYMTNYIQKELAPTPCRQY